MALAFAAFVLLVLFVLRAALRKTLELLRRIQAHLARYAAVASQDYVDEITDTREDGGERSGSLLERIRRRTAMMNESALTPAQRIRYRYRQLLRRHPDWHASRTARETLPLEAANLYEEARYSGHDINAEDAARFAEKAKRI